MNPARVTGGGLRFDRVRNAVLGRVRLTSTNSRENIPVAATRT